MGESFVKHYSSRQLGSIALTLTVVVVLAWAIWPRGRYQPTPIAPMPEPSVAYVSFEGGRDAFLSWPDSIIMSITRDQNFGTLANNGDASGGVPPELDKTPRSYILDGPARSNEWRKYDESRGDESALDAVSVVTELSPVFSAAPQSARVFAHVSPSLISSGFRLPATFLSEVYDSAIDSDPYRVELSLFFSDEGQLDYMFVETGDCNPDVIKSIRLALMSEVSTEPGASGRLVVYYSGS